MGAPTTIGVNDDLTSSQTSITLRSANDELARGLDLALYQHRIDVATVQMDLRGIQSSCQGNGQG